MLKVSCSSQPFPFNKVKTKSIKTRFKQIHLLPSNFSYPAFPNIEI